MNEKRKLSSLSYLYVDDVNNGSVARAMDLVSLKPSGIPITQAILSFTMGLLGRFV